MTGVIRKATLLVALGLVAATSAMAGIPSAANCDVPGFIKVVGTAATVPDPRGVYTIVVRDIGNFPVENCLVSLDFSACSDMKLCSSGPGVVCGPPARVEATTDALGQVVFTVVGGGLHPGGAGFPGPGVGCVTVTACTYPIGTATANVYDLNGATAGAGKNGVLITDLPLFLADWGGGAAPYVGRSDFNQSGPAPNITIQDLVPWLQIWGGTVGSVGGCATTYCP